MTTTDDPDLRFRWRRADGRLIVQFYDAKTDSWWELDATLEEWHGVIAELCSASSGERKL